MHYSEDRYGFAFDLPPGWQRMTTLAGRHFELLGQHLQMMSGPALPQFLDPAARANFLKEPGSRVLPDEYLGGEANSVVVVSETGQAMAVSTVRDGLHYFFEFDSADRRETAETINLILQTFTFPSRAQAMQILEDLRVDTLPPVLPAYSTARPPSALPAWLELLVTVGFWLLLAAAVLYWLRRG